jgi:hypothetical protein
LAAKISRKRRALRRGDLGGGDSEEEDEDWLRWRGSDALVLIGAIARGTRLTAVVLSPVLA